MENATSRRASITFVCTLLIAAALVGAQGSKPAPSTNPSLLLGKPFAEFDMFFGKPTKVESYKRKAMVPGKSYTDEEMAALPELPVEDRYYTWKGMEVHAYQGPTDKQPAGLRFRWNKGTPKTWKEALAAVGIPQNGVTATTSKYDKSDKDLKAKTWRGLWTPAGDEQGYHLGIDSR